MKLTQRVLRPDPLRTERPPYRLTVTPDDAYQQLEILAQWRGRPNQIPFNCNLRLMWDEDGVMTISIDPDQWKELGRDYDPHTGVTIFGFGPRSD